MANRGLAHRSGSLNLCGKKRDKRRGKVGEGGKEKREGWKERRKNKGKRKEEQKKGRMKGRLYVYKEESALSLFMGIIGADF